MGVVILIILGLLVLPALVAGGPLLNMKFSEKNRNLIEGMKRLN